MINRVFSLPPQSTTPTERLVLLCFASHANDDGGNAFPERAAHCATHVPDPETDPIHARPPEGQARNRRGRSGRGRTPGAIPRRPDATRKATRGRCSSAGRGRSCSAGGALQKRRGGAAAAHRGRCSSTRSVIEPSIETSGTHTHGRRTGRERECERPGTRQREWKRERRRIRSFLGRLSQARKKKKPPGRRGRSAGRLLNSCR